MKWRKSQNNIKGRQMTNNLRVPFVTGSLYSGMPQGINDGASNVLVPVKLHDAL